MIFTISQKGQVNSVSDHRNNKNYNNNYNNNNSDNNTAAKVKSILTNSVVDGILLMILGVIFLIWPGQSLVFFLHVIGIILLIMGGVGLLVIIFRKKKQGNTNANTNYNANQNAYANANRNVYTNTNANPGAYGNTNQNTYANTNPNTYGGGNPNSNAYANPNAYGNQNAYANQNAYRNQNAYANPNAYAGAAPNANPNGQKAAGSSIVGSIVLSVIQIVIGILLLVKSDFFIAIFPYLAGAVIAIGAVISLVNAMKQKKQGNAPLAVPTIILSVIALILGIVVIFHPGFVTNILMQLIGVAMLVDGVAVLLALSKSS